MKRFIDQPLGHYVIVSVVSLCVSLICFKLGGSLAEISGNEKSILGVSFKASGAIGGFLIVFFSSFKVLGPPSRGGRLRVKVHLEPRESFSNGTEYTCQALLFNTESGERRTVTAHHGWENGFLTLTILDVHLDEMVAALIVDSRERRWQLQDFAPLTSKRSVTPVEVP